MRAGGLVCVAILGMTALCAGPACTGAGARAPADAATDGASPPAADGSRASDVVADVVAPTPAAPAPAKANYSVHEWATFTVFHATSAQQHVAGVQRHEEDLPAAVHVRDLGPKGSGAAELLGEPVLAKVQTAGLWFQAVAPLAVTVTVSVPDGIVTADHPTAGATAPKLAAVTSLAGGKASWALQVLGAVATPGSEPGGGMLALLGSVLSTPFRQFGAKPGAESSVLFWRALAKFSPPVRFDASPMTGMPGKFHVTVWNDGDHVIPQAFLLHLHAGGGLLQIIGPVGTRQFEIQTPTPKEGPKDYFKKVHEVLSGAVQEQGLSAGEADALVKTFTHNWLKTHGLRVIVVAPPAWGQQWFPTTFMPPPAQHVRVVLGRFELLTASDEAALVQTVEAAAQQQDLGVLAKLGFFAEPKARRVLQLAAQGAQAFVQKLVEAAGALK